MGAQIEVCKERQLHKSANIASINLISQDDNYNCTAIMVHADTFDCQYHKPVWESNYLPLMVNSAQAARVTQDKFNINIATSQNVAC